MVVVGFRSALAGPINANLQANAEIASSQKALLAMTRVQAGLEKLNRNPHRGRWMFWLLDIIPPVGTRLEMPSSGMNRNPQAGVAWGRWMFWLLDQDSNLEPSG